MTGAAEPAEREAGDAVDIQEPRGTRIEEITDRDVDASTHAKSTPAEKIMSVTKTSIKTYKPKTYEEAINDPIHSREWKEAIQKKDPKLGEPSNVRVVAM